VSGPADPSRSGDPARLGGRGRPACSGGLTDPDELAALEEQRDFLLASIKDLEREHEAGDLDDDDFETLRDDYTARAAETLRAIKERRSAFDAARRPRSLARTLAVFGGVALFAALAGLLVARTLGARSAEDTATGGIGTERTPNQRAQACQQLWDPAEPDEAVACFEGVLNDDPRNVVANTWLAWQLEIAGGTNLSKAQRDRIEQLVETALDQNPDYSYAKAFRAIIAFRHGKPEEASRYLDEFEASDPAPDARRIIEQFQLRERIEDARTDSGPDREAERCRGLVDPREPIPALTCFQAVLDGDPDNVSANTWMAFQLEQTVDLLPLADAVATQRRVDEYLDAALAADPRDPYALALRAIFAYKHGDTDTSRAMYERLLAVDPPDDAREIVDQVRLGELLEEG